MTISLPNQIVGQIDTEIRKLGFATRSEFVRSLLRRYFVKELEFETFHKRPLEEIKFELAKTGKYDKKFINSLVKGLSKSSLYAS